MELMFFLFFFGGGQFNQLMKDFPLNELLSAADLDEIQESHVLIFGHINRKLKLFPYPIRRPPLSGSHLPRL